MKLPDFVAAFARAAPDREAVVCGGMRLSFAELHEQSTRLACGLGACGVQVGDRVALCLSNRLEFVVGLLACMKAGAIAVALNPRYMAKELGEMLADCGPKAVIYENATRDAIVRANASVPLHINTDKPRDPEELCYGEVASKVGRLPEVPPEFDDCMICYTSGTTGKAKGAIITQSNYIISNGYFNVWLWGMSAQDRVLTTTPLAHRTALSRLMNTFAIGSSIVIMQKFEPKQAAELVERERITVIMMVPTVGRLLVPEIEDDPSRFYSLRLAVVTGEAFPVELKQRLARALPQLKLVSYFTQTEAGAITCLGPDPREQLEKAASVGRVIPGVDLRLLGEDGAPVRTGEAGEIAVRTGAPGRYVTMRGYFNNPQANASTLRDGWLRTGDIGRFDEDGYLYVIDRKKDMVLSGGYNIYPKEVEAVILELSAVRDVGVVGVPDAVFGEAVAAFVEPQPGAALDAATVIAHCRERIAGYKKPKYVYFVESLPRNSSGKVLKRELRERFDRANNG